MGQIAGSGTDEVHRSGRIDDRGVPRWLVVAAVAAAVAVVLGGIALLDERELQLRTAAQSQLVSIARLKADQVATWRRGLLATGRSLEGRVYLAAAIGRLVQGGDPAGVEEVGVRLRTLLDGPDVIGVMVADPSGHARLDLELGEKHLHSAASGALTEALRSGRTVLSELHDGPDGLPPHVDVVTPIAAPGETPPRILAAIVVRFDVRDTLYPLVSAWPTPSPSAEGILLRREGGQVRVLSPLRGRPGAAMEVVAPLSVGPLLQATALPGRRGAVGGVDYRGVAVLGSVETIAGSSWLLLVKEDVVDALAGWRREALLVAALVITLVALVLVAAFIVRRRRREGRYRAWLRADVAMRATQEAHRATLMSVGDAVITVDGEERVSLMNRLAEELTGWPEDDARGRLLREVLHPIDEATRAPITLGVSGDPGARSVGPLACCILDRAGAERPVAATVAPIGAGDGGHQGVVLVLRDQAPTREVERALREGERRLLESQRVARIGHYRLDLRAGLWTSSPLLDAIFGLPSGGPHPVEDWISVIRSDWRAVMNDYLQSEVLGSGRPFDKEYPIVRQSDGAVRWVHGIGRLEPDEEGRPIAMYGTIQDVTERHASGERIAHLNRVLRAVGDVTRLTVRARDGEQLLRDACEVLVQDRGYEAAIVVLMDEDLRPTAVVQAGAEADARTLSAMFERRELPPCFVGASRSDGVHVVAERAAQCATCAVSAHRCRSSDSMVVRLWSGGQTLGVIHVTLSTGENADADEQSLLLALADDLAFALESLALRAAKERVEAERDAAHQQLAATLKLEAVGRLAGGIAHDFNNLLSVILSYTTLAIDGLREGDPLRDDLLDIKAAGERGALLTRQLLAFSRKQLLQPVVVGLDGIVDGMVQLLRRLLGEDVELVVVHSPGLWSARVDPGQIEQSIMNLAVNARDAMPRGGKLVIETSNAELDAEYARSHVSVQPGQYVRLTVSDNGCGMDRATSARVFEPFFTTKDKGKGTGLGLSTVYGIVKQSGGNIWVYSEPGHGTAIKIYLPRVLSGTTQPTMAAVPELRHRGSETILVVEDEEAVRNIALRVLRSAGYSVLAAASGGDALVASERHEGTIHLLLADVVMPRLSGPEVAARLVVERPDMRVLFMSGYTDSAIVEHGALAPGTHFIGKPFNVSDLLAKVRSTLDGAPGVGVSHGSAGA